MTSRPSDGGTPIDQTARPGRSGGLPPRIAKFWPYRQQATLRYMSSEESVPAWYGHENLKNEALSTLRRHRATGSLVPGERQLPDSTLPSGYRADVIGAVLPLLDP